MGIELWSTTPASNNSAPPDGAPEGMSAGSVNDTMRKMMASIRSWMESAQWLPFGHTPTYIGATQFSVPGDQTSVYTVGRRIKAVGTTPFTIYGRITASAFTTLTTVTVVWDSGSLNNTLTTVYPNINNEVIATAATGVSVSTSLFTILTGSTVQAVLDAVDDEFALLGTAAFLDTGTTANKVVKLDASAKLPAVDGSQLTNLPATGITAATIASYHPSGRLLGGCVLSNAADTVNDVTISAGTCVSDDGTTLMTISSAITKQLDASWAVGNNAGGRDTGAISDAPWYVWVINRPDTGVTDVLFSLSSSSPTMPTNYTKKYFIGGFNRVSGGIVNNEFNQNGKFKTANRTVTTNSTVTVAHCLGALPDRYEVHAVCVSAEGIFSVGDRFKISSFNNAANNPTNATAYANTNNVVCHVTGNGLYQEAALTDAKWKLELVAERIRP